MNFSSIFIAIFLWCTAPYVGKYFSVTISSHSSLCAGEQVSEEPLGVVGVSHGLAQTVDKDRSPTVGLKHWAEQSLKEDEEFLVLCRNAHLIDRNQAKQKQREKVSD